MSQTDTITHKGKKTKNPATRFIAQPPQKVLLETSIKHYIMCTLLCNEAIWIKPSGERKTCLCNLYENTRLILLKLIQLEVISTSNSNVSSYVKRMVCEDLTETCYIGD